MDSSVGSIDALILCGGRGIRLGHMTKNVPKPMLEVGGKPFLELLIEKLIEKGLKRFLLCAGYKGFVVKEYFSAFHRRGVEITVLIEETPLDTFGALINASPFVRSDPFFVFNGDSFCETDLGKMVELFNSDDVVGLLCVTQNAVEGGKEKGSYGAVVLDGDFRIVRFDEKGSAGESGLINAGIYLFSRKVFQFLKSVPSSLEKDLLPRLAADGSLRAFKTDGVLIDIGTPERIETARRVLRNG